MVSARDKGSSGGGGGEGVGVPCLAVLAEEGEDANRRRTRGRAVVELDCGVFVVGDGISNVGIMLGWFLFFIVILNT